MKPMNVCILYILSFLNSVKFVLGEMLKETLILEIVSFSNCWQEFLFDKVWMVIHGKVRQVDLSINKIELEWEKTFNRSHLKHTCSKQAVKFLSEYILFVWFNSVCPPLGPCSPQAATWGQVQCSGWHSQVHSGSDLQSCPLDYEASFSASPVANTILDIYTIFTCGSKSINTAVYLSICVSIYLSFCPSQIFLKVSTKPLLRPGCLQVVV